MPSAALSTSSACSSSGPQSHLQAAPQSSMQLAATRWHVSISRSSGAMPSLAACGISMALPGAEIALSLSQCPSPPVSEPQSGCAACSKNMFHASEKGKVEYTKQLSESLEQRGLRLETTYFLSSLALMAPIHTVFTYFVKQRALVAIFGVKPGRDTQPFTQLCQSSGPYGILMVGSSHKPAQAHRHMCAS